MSDQTALPPEIVLREGAVADACALAELDIRCFAIPWSEQAFAADLNDCGKTCYYVLEKEGKLIGYGGWWRVVDEAEIMNIAVDPHYRRRGLAMVLLAALVRQAQKEGLTAMTLEVREGNHPAIALYSRFGFEKAGLRREYYADNKENAIIMLKKLN
jgi:ribosomal-protein-alanine N-acetyltransferase